LSSERYLNCDGSLCLRPYLPPDSQGRVGHLTGDIRRHTIPSKLVGNREILVYLPPGYSEKDNYSYPFALLQDGQNIFDAESAVFGVEWGVDEAAEQLITEQKMQPAILVAVYNSPRRIAEYTPFPDPEHNGGEAPLYRAFLISELIPFLEETYRVSRIREERVVIGSSLGGLLSLYLGWTRSDIFGGAAALSPSLWWGRRGFITALGGNDPPELPPKIWLDAGTEESDLDGNDNGISDLIDDLRTLRAVLHYHGYSEEQNLIYREIEGGTHTESSWSKRVGEVLTYFFPKQTKLRM